MRQIRWIVLLAPIIIFARVAAADPSTIAGIARTCAGCHGPKGVSPGQTIPSLAGLKAKHIADAMRRYRDGRRTFYVMRFIARGLTDGDIEGIAKYFAKQKFVYSIFPHDAAKAKLGAALAKNCAACHGIKGQGSEIAPRLAGQPVEYINLAMRAYVGGGRKASKVMAASVQGLSKADMNNLSHYFASQE